MQNTRQDILAYLQANHTATANQLSRALQITSADARYHLGWLAREGLVEVITQRPTTSRGRPTQVYSLTQSARSNNLPLLAQALLSALQEEAQPQVLHRAARLLAGERNTAPLNLTPRLGRAVQHLNALHYQARWEAHAHAPHIILGYCPYLAILPAHPVLCQMDAWLLEELLGQPVVQSIKLAPTELGNTSCVFLVLNRPAGIA